MGRLFRPPLLALCVLGRFQISPGKLLWFTNQQPRYKAAAVWLGEQCLVI